jgi:hypothetical protein
MVLKIGYKRWRRRLVGGPRVEKMKVANVVHHTLYVNSNSIDFL